jgi:F-type H+-transporting ATPase subunit b
VLLQRLVVATLYLVKNKVKEMEKLLNEFSVGLFFWQTVLFLALLLLLRKFAWKPILNAVNDRETQISDSLEQAEKAKKELELLKSQNEDLLKEARAERDSMIKDAKATATKMVEDAKNSAKQEGALMITNARASIESEKVAVIAELKSQVASLSIEIAEKVLKGELSTADKQKVMAEKLAEDINLN